MADNFFDSIDDLARHLSGGNGLSDITDVEKALIEAGSQLEEIIKQEIRIYLDSYKPEVYIRTDRWVESLKVSPPKMRGLNEMYVEIYFDPIIANHPSWIGDNQPNGFVPILMDRGWNVSRGWHKDIYRFGYFEGIHYIHNAIEKFNNKNTWGFAVEVTSDGDPYL